MDGTITDLLPSWVKKLNEKHGTNVDHRNIKFWDMEKNFPTLTRDEIFEPLSLDDFWKTVFPISGAQISIRSLLEASHEVYIVTSSGYETLKSKMNNLLFKYFPFLSWDNLIIAKNKQMIDGDVLIDDNPDNLIGGKYIKILLNKSYNEDFDAESNGVLRAHSWNQIFSMLCDIDQELHTKNNAENLDDINTIASKASDAIKTTYKLLHEAAYK